MEAAVHFDLAPYSYAEAHALSAELGVSEPVAVTLVRRGYRSPEAARAFLEASETHHPFLFEGMREAVELLLEACREGERITVHGDYDVDGVCATAILVGALRELGGTCDWVIPDRGEGYGLSEATIGQLAARGTGVLVTVDCGIGSADEVAIAQEAGMRVVVTDHHSPPERLPECTILHPVISGYPFAELCGAAVAGKLAAALRATAGVEPETDGDLDLVALATVADLVPLRGENRTLVRQGLELARRSRRPGLRALCAVAAVEQAELDEGSIGFRLAPRINATGRLYRADAGVELMLTADEARAAEVAAELDRANVERREIELVVRSAAEKALGKLPERLREAPAIVVAGEGWHPGVVGIVASRLVERFWKPAIVIALDAEGGGRGSGRSIPGYNLLAALDACSEHLLRHGGHAMAAGLEIEAGALDGFREAFAAHAAEALGPEELARAERVDAVIGSEGLGLELAEELRLLGPFGNGNPAVSLLVPAATLSDMRPMGEGKHARFELHSGGARARAVAFGRGGKLTDAPDEPHDLAVRLEVNRWNGSVEPRAVLREIQPLETGARSRLRALDPAEPGEWWRRCEAELEAPLDAWPPPALAAAIEPAGRARREVVDRRGRSPVAALSELVSCGEAVIALCADAGRRRELAERAAPPRRLGTGSPLLLSARAGDAELRQAVEQGARGLVLCDWEALIRCPELVDPFEHVLCVDPPQIEQLAKLAARGRGGPWAPGWLHLGWGAGEVAFARQVAEHSLASARVLREVYRELRDRASRKGELAGEPLLAALAGGGEHPRSPEQAGRCLRVLGELELVELLRDGGGYALRVVSSDQVELERSRAFVAYRARHQEVERFLSQQEQAQNGQSPG